MLLLEDTSAVLSLGKLCEDHGKNHHWTSGQKPQLIKNGRSIATQRTTYHSLFLVYRQAFQAHLHLCLLHYSSQEAKNSYTASRINEK